MLGIIRRQGLSFLMRNAAEWLEVVTWKQKTIIRVSPAGPAVPCTVRRFTGPRPTMPAGLSLSI